MEICMKELEYPFDAEKILKQKKSLKRHLLENQGENLIDVRTFPFELWDKTVLL